MNTKKSINYYSFDDAIIIRDVIILKYLILIVDLILLIGNDNMGHGCPDYPNISCMGIEDSVKVYYDNFIGVLK